MVNYALDLVVYLVIWVELFEYVVFLCSDSRGMVDEVKRSSSDEFPSDVEFSIVVSRDPVNWSSSAARAF